MAICPIQRRFVSPSIVTQLTRLGPRICVGQNFALTEMAYVVVRMAQRFERMEYRGVGEQSHKVEIVGTPAVSIQMAFWEPEKH
jgi:hypothetical protein